LAGEQFKYFIVNFMKMELGKILLRPDELPIFESGSEIIFFMPIYPPLL